MAYINVTLDVPNELVSAVSDGSIKLMGLAKNTSSMTVVKHLDTVSIENKDIVKASTKGMASKKGLIIGIGVLGGIALTATIATLIMKKKKIKAENEVIDAIAINYNNEVSTYINNARNCKLSMNDVKAFFEYVNCIIQDIDDNIINVELSSDEILVLKKLLGNFTIKLCKANNIESNVIKEISAPQTDYDNLVYIRNCLEVQQKIYS